MEILLTEQQIQDKVRELAAAISQLYGQRTVHLIGLLHNGFMFAADLARRLTCPVVCDFVRVDMQDVLEDGHERRLIRYGPRLEVRNQDLLLADCVLHTGVVQDHLIQQFRAKGAASIRVAVLIDKSEERHVDLQPDFAGFQLQNRFLIGYGLGHKGLYRNLPYVAALESVLVEEARVTSAAGDKQ